MVPSIGDSVLVRSNEEKDPLWAGILIRFERIAGNDIPVILDSNKTEWYVMGIIIADTKANVDRLAHLSHKAQWDLLLKERLDSSN